MMISPNFSSFAPSTFTTAAVLSRPVARNPRGKRDLRWKNFTSRVDPTASWRGSESASWRVGEGASLAGDHGYRAGG